MSERVFPVRSWSEPIAVDNVPETGRRVELAPDAAMREAIAKEIGVAALPRLEAEFDLTRHGGDGLRVVGRVSATVGQNCVVTLDPIQSEVDEAIDLVFIPQPEAGSKGPEPEGPLVADADEPPETLHGGAVDLGAVATEFLMLGIDPYPRKPGAVFEAPPAGDPAAHPFAVLAALKKGPERKDR
jgi:uncharacterized metal-binding protein YceD (DUF177 family)